ncbi:replication associated protein [Termite associated circular virus 1]|uniref:replication associated protein n=1 Tax=Termite associated circular virus 1 TaxID=2108549 RepID=UPI000DC61826|nr:replication associated protein [Termite associated circular virus 1]AVK87309.2 replication associated protein [Termite associated circular virus 1]
MSFRWQGRYLFLTYAQAGNDFTPNELITFIRESGRKQPGYILIGKERHQDGGLHYHCFVDWVKRFSFTNAARFDFGGHHPNISPVNSPKACLDYCSKDGDTTSWGTPPDLDSNHRESRNELWSRLLDTATNPPEFLQLVREHAPYDFATRYTQLDTMARAVYRPRTNFTSEFEHEDFTLPEGIEGWISSLFTKTRTAPYDPSHSSSSATLVPERPVGRGRLGTTYTSRDLSTSTNSMPRQTTSFSTTAKSSSYQTTSPGWGAGASSKQQTSTEEKEH